MFSKEKLIIRFNRLIRSISFHFIFWELAFLLFVFLVTDNYLFRIYEKITTGYSFSFFIAYLGFYISLLFSLVDLIFTDRLVRFFPLRLTLFLKSLVNFGIAFALIWAAESQNMNRVTVSDINGIVDSLTDANIHIIRFLVYFYLMCYLNNLLFETIKKIGSGNISSWLSGVLNKPHEEERIFMFIDLKSSTTLAEKLGHRKFSHLVQDIFNDLAVVDNYGGEIYQYLGDGAIISWNVRKGLKNNNFIHAFFAVTGILDRRRRYYRRKYGTEPKFKAGTHTGKVMVLQVGQIRRDISYNGDTMNTAARIESKCNELRQSLLISADLYEKLTDKKEFRFANQGDIPLRGKRKAVEIYGVKQKPSK